MKINILLILCIPFISFTTFANSLDSIQEILPIDNPEYIGYRLAVTNIILHPQKNNTRFKIDCTIINTGRQDLLFWKTITPPPQLVINFDESLYAHNLSSHIDEIREALNKSDFHLVAGTILEGHSIQIGTAMPEQIAETESELESEPVATG